MLSPYPIGSGAATTVAFWNGTRSLTNNSQIAIDNSSPTSPSLQIRASTGTTRSFMNPFYSGVQYNSTNYAINNISTTTPLFINHEEIINRESRLYSNSLQFSNLSTSGYVALSPPTSFNNRNYTLPDSSGTIALNEYTVNSISRTPGKDSIIFYVGSTRYAIKDSVGTATGFVPYTGATTDLNMGAKNVTANAYFNGFTSMIAAGTTVTLTIDSTPVHNVTGSGGQTYQLPNATTLTNGTIFSFNNNQSSGNISVNNNSGTLVKAVGSGGYMTLELTNNTTAAGTWDSHFQTPSNVSWSTNTFDYGGSITSAQWNGTTVAYNRGGTGQSSLFTQGGVAYGSTTTALGTTAAGTAGQMLVSAGTGTPIWADTSVFLRKTDSTIYYTKYRSDTSRTNIYSAISGKVSTSDTTVFQRKNIAAYSLQANNTASAANVTTQTYRDVAEQNISGTIAWVGTTAPSSLTSANYSWSQIGKTVTVEVNLLYANASLAITAFSFPLPSDMPTPVTPTGWSAASNYLFTSICTVHATTPAISSTSYYGFIRRDAANTGYELGATGSAATARGWKFTLTYKAQ